MIARSRIPIQHRTPRAHVPPLPPRLLLVKISAATSEPLVPLHTNQPAQSAFEAKKRISDRIAVIGCPQALGCNFAASRRTNSVTVLALSLDQSTSASPNTSCRSMRAHTAQCRGSGAQHFGEVAIKNVMESSPLRSIDRRTRIKKY
jgi:hypothetical protein